jgi:hypothetical protein
MSEAETRRETETDETVNESEPEAVTAEPRP